MVVVVMMMMTIIIHKSQKFILDFNREIQEREQGKTYKYLGTEESEGIQHLK